MMLPGLHDALSAGSLRLGIELSDRQLAQLGMYWELLEHWNATINLTALPLNGHPQSSLDRLLLEPIAALRLMPPAPAIWYDLGSGNGSPAVPLSIVSPDLRLLMVESRTRKAAFLREVVRSLALSTASVLAERFEELTGQGREVADCVTVRAVRPDATLLAACAALLKPKGRLLLFGPSDRSLDELPGFTLTESLPSPSAASSIHAYVPRGTFRH